MRAGKGTGEAMGVAVGDRGGGFWSLALRSQIEPSPVPPALRKARREQQLVSKRLLREDAQEEIGGEAAATTLGEAEVRGQGGCALPNFREFAHSVPKLIHATRTPRVQWGQARNGNHPLQFIVLSPFNTS